MARTNGAQAPTPTWIIATSICNGINMVKCCQMLDTDVQAGGTPGQHLGWRLVSVVVAASMAGTLTAVLPPSMAHTTPGNQAPCAYRKRTGAPGPTDLLPLIL